MNDIDILKQKFDAQEQLLLKVISLLTDIRRKLSNEPEPEPITLNNVHRLVTRTPVLPPNPH